MTWYSESSSCFVATILGAIVTITIFSSGFGCSGSNRDCTTNVVRSVAVHVEDENGATVDSPAVEYRRVDRDEEFRICEGEGGQYGSVTGIYEFTCGDEASGLIELRATTSDGKSGEATADVSADECHVRTELVTIVVN